MKKFSPLILCLLPVSVFGQGGMPPMNMEKMMEQAEKMEQCLQGIDERALDQFSARSEKIEAEIRTLCRAGKRSEAQRVAIDFGREVAASKEMQKLRECASIMRGMGGATPLPTPKELERRHICDDY